MSNSTISRSRGSRSTQTRPRYEVGRDPSGSIVNKAQVHELGWFHTCLNRTPKPNPQHGMQRNKTAGTHATSRQISQKYQWNRPRGCPPSKGLNCLLPQPANRHRIMLVSVCLSFFTFRTVQPFFTTNPTALTCLYVGGVRVSHSTGTADISRWLMFNKTLEVSILCSVSTNCSLHQSHPWAFHRQALVTLDTMSSHPLALRHPEEGEDSSMHAPSYQRAHPQYSAPWSDLATVVQMRFLVCINAAGSLNQQNTDYIPNVERVVETPRAAFSLNMRPVFLLRSRSYAAV